MPGRVSCRLYLLLNALENFDISRDLWSREISNFPTHLEVNTTDRKHTLSLYSIYFPQCFQPLPMQTSVVDSAFYIYSVVCRCFNSLLHRY